MPRHAYLILAHDNPRILGRLAALLDHPDSDLFIHIDRKADEEPFCRAVGQMRHSGLYFIDDARRQDVRWGDYSIVAAQYALLNRAHAAGGYSYYHLLSGVDLPLRSQEDIHKFFAVNHGREFIGFLADELWDSARVRYRHIAVRQRKDKHKWIRTAALLSDRIFVTAQAALGLDRMRRSGLTPKKGSNWASISSQCAELLLSREEQVRRLFAHSLCPDEIYIQTTVWNSSLRERIFDAQGMLNGNLRAIDWERGTADSPYTYRAGDVDALMEGNKLFARKFSDAVDPLAVDLIYESIDR